MPTADQKHNLNPHAPARAAMWLYSERYAKQGDGSMDFWNKLSAREKRLCRKMAEEIRTARAEG